MRTTLLFGAILLTACGLVSGIGGGIEPGGLSEAPAAMGENPTGPITVLGRGTFEGAEWRYSIYQSVLGWCTQFEFPTGGGAGCGGESSWNRV